MLCIYHKNCMDGWFAAAVVKMKFGDDVKLYAAEYGDQPPAIDDGETVMIVDFSYNRETLIKLNERCRLTVIDHHKTAEQELSGLDFVTFDTDHCGAVLTWKRLFQTTTMPQILAYVEDRDLWKWAQMRSRQINAALRLRVSSVDEALIVLLDDTLMMLYELSEQGEIILKYQTRIIDQAVENAGRMMIDGHTVPVVNTTILISEIVGKLASDGNFPFAVGYFDLADKRVYSLRSRKNGVDVSEIAKKFGGGGHKHAAGFTVKMGNHEQIED